MLGVLISALFIYAAVLGYLLPYFLADRRSHPNATAIFFLTVLFGWTGLGWAIALLWAVSARSKARTQGALPALPLRTDSPAS
ncbi:superinfection immunity protein [Dongia soli]|uniref:Superinfection immunity protein n=1 Tax=Dongia soli TaxID=600628 RepID=A0ABU5EF24_9PROT|nr:superinfection immunity protein [Dongia soli]MDY0884999.1 superinfection immunity protein [Dongia soli]